LSLYKASSLLYKDEIGFKKNKIAHHKKLEYRMKLHQNISLFRDAVRATAQQMNIPPEFVKKRLMGCLCFVCHFKQ
jgi:hypothetical protein